MSDRLTMTMKYPGFVPYFTIKINFIEIKICLEENIMVHQRGRRRNT